MELPRMPRSSPTSCAGLNENDDLVGGKPAATTGRRFSICRNRSASRRWHRLFQRRSRRLRGSFDDPLDAVLIGSVVGFGGTKLPCQTEFFVADIDGKNALRASEYSAEQCVKPDTAKTNDSHRITGAYLRCWPPRPRQSLPRSQRWRPRPAAVPCR